MMKKSTMPAKWLSLIRLYALEPRLALLAWQVKRGKKTFLSWPKLLSLGQSFHLLRSRQPQKPLRVSEFGVGRGGSAMLLGWLVGHYGGSITLYDVFGQIPAPTQSDGEQAQKRYEKIQRREGQDYYGNLPNLLEIVLADISRVCPRERIAVVQGKYEEVLPERKAPDLYDLVHVDCDWYESSRAVLAYLKDHLSPGAILQIDDYGHWQGSRKAFDEAGWLSCFQVRRVDDALLIDTACVNSSI